MNTAEIVRKYARPRARTDTVVNFQYQVEVALACGVRAFAASEIRDDEPVPSEAADGLLELARWMAYFEPAWATPGIVEPPPVARAPIFGVPLTVVPSGEYGVRWVEGVQDHYRLWLVTHIRTTPLEPVIGSWPDDLPLVDNSGGPFLTELLSGFKCRVALRALIGRVETLIEDILSDDGDLWSWTDADPADWHPEQLLEVVCVMRRRLREVSAAERARCRR